MGQARIQLTSPVKGYLDIKDNFSVPINISLGDIRDISKRNGSYSRTITLIGNANNNRLLGYLFDVNISESSFNINTLQECLIEQDGQVILDNLYLQLTSIKKIQDSSSYDEYVEYECEVKDSTSDFFTKINNLELTDLDLSAFNHIYDVVSVTQSFDNTYVDGYKYLMPYISGGNSYVIQDFKPAIYNRIYWDKIFDNAGYTYTFDEIDNLDIRFNQLIIPYNGDKPKPIEDQTIWVTASSSVYPITKTTNTFSPTPKQQIILDNENDPSGYYNPTLGEYTLPFNIINPDSVVYEYNITYNIILTNPSPVSNLVINSSGSVNNLPPQYFIKLYSNDNYASGYVFNGPFDSITPLSSITLVSNVSQKITSNVTNLNIGDSVLNYLDVSEISNGSFWASPALIETPLPIEVTVEITSIEMVIKPSIDTFVLGSTLTMNSFIPKKIKQSDYIKALCQMYNLYIDVDKDNITNLLIKTRDTFYDEGVVVDWTDKLAKDITQDIKFLPDLGDKKLVLTYKDDKDTLNSNYKTIINETYGQLEYVFENEYVRNTKRQELMFSPTPMLYTDFQANVPALIGIPNCNIRILLDNGVKDCFEYTINLTQSSAATLTEYPFLSHFNDADNPTFDLNYGICDFYFYNPNSLDGVEFNNLTYYHWIRTLNQINDGKLLSANFNLNSNDIAKLRLNDKIRIDNSYWNINKVIDYDANSNNLTRVELISIDDDLELPTFVRKTVYQPVDGDIELLGKDKMTNAIGKNIYNYNNIDASNGKTEINGIFNQTNNLASGYIDGDRNTYMGPGYTEIKGSGNTASSAAMIYANNNIIDEDLVNVFSFKDDYHATQSNQFVIPENLWIVGPTPSINGIPYPSGLQENLEETLAIGNNTGTYSIIMDTTTVIKSGNGGGQLDLDYLGSTGEVILSTDNGLLAESYLYLNSGTVQLKAGNGSVIDLGDAVGISSTTFDGVTITTGIEGFNINTRYNNVLVGNAIFFKDNFGVAVTSANNDLPGILIGSKNSTINTGVVNTVVIGGNGITASQSDYAYVYNLNIFNTPSNGSTSSNLLLREPTGEVRLSIFTENDLNNGLSASLLGWPGVLAINNTSGGSDVIITNGDILRSETGSTLNIQSDTLMDIRFDDGLGDISQLYMESLYVSLGIDNGTSGLEFDTNNNFSIYNNNIDLTANSTKVKLYTKNTSLSLGSSSSKDELIILNNSAASRTSTNTDNNSIFVGSKNSTMGLGIINSVILGGSSQKGDYNNTVYTPDQFRQADGNHNVTTTNNTITNLYTFTPVDNGVYLIEWMINGIENATGDAIGVKAFATFKVIAGVVTQVSTTTLDRKSNFPASVTVTIDTDSTQIRCRVTGRTGSTIQWAGSCTITK